MSWYYLSFPEKLNDRLHFAQGQNVSKVYHDTVETNWISSTERALTHIHCTSYILTTQQVREALFLKNRRQMEEVFL